MGFAKNFARNNEKKKLGASDNCLMSCLSYRPRVLYWRLTDFRSAGSADQPQSEMGTERWMIIVSEYLLNAMRLRKYLNFQMGKIILLNSEKYNLSLQMISSFNFVAA